MRRDYAAAFAAGMILIGVFIIGGIAYTYMNRPTALTNAVSRVLNIRQLFEENFR